MTATVYAIADGTLIYAVGETVEMSKTPSLRTATTLGPAAVSIRPTRVPAVPSIGRISATGRLRFFVAQQAPRFREH